MKGLGNDNKNVKGFGDDYKPVEELKDIYKYMKVFGDDWDNYKYVEGLMDV